MKSINHSQDLIRVSFKGAWGCIYNMDIDSGLILRPRLHLNVCANLMKFIISVNSESDMINDLKRLELKKQFSRLFSIIAEEIEYEETSLHISNFNAICSALNICYKSSKPSASQFVELLECYIEFFKEKTLM